MCEPPSDLGSYVALSALLIGKNMALLCQNNSCIIFMMSTCYDFMACVI